MEIPSDLMELFSAFADAGVQASAGGRPRGSGAPASTSPGIVLTFVRVGGRLEVVQVRPKSASADAANDRDREKIARLSVLERMAKALALGRRGRRLRDMVNAATKGHG